MCGCVYICVCVCAPVLYACMSAIAHLDAPLPDVAHRNCVTPQGPWTRAGPPTISPAYGAAHRSTSWGPCPELIRHIAMVADQLAGMA